MKPGGFSLSKMTFNPLDYPVCWSAPHRLAATTWADNVPFGMFLIDFLRPDTVVELGTFRGVSYCAFCQAVKELGLDTRCYAVDTWKGDPHSGEFGAEILDELRRYHDPLYGGFSRLIARTFDEALGEFGDGTIDLLHIDGYHRYDAVKHDFERWLPKLSSRGVVLLHDIVVRDGDFGAWKLWEELQQRYPSLDLPHGKGLGVLAVGSNAPVPLREMLDLPKNGRRQLQRFFAALGMPLQRQVDTTHTVETLEWKVNDGAKIAEALTREIRDQLTPALRERIADAERLSAVLAERDTAVSWLEREVDVARRDAAAHASELSSRTQELTARDAQLADRTQQLAARDAQLADRAAQLSEREAQLAGRDKQLADRDTRLAERDRVIEAMSAEADGLRRDIAAVEARLAELSAAEAQLRDAVAAETQKTAERERDIVWLQDVVAKAQEALRERDEGIGWLKGELAEARQLRERVQTLNESLSDQLHEILGSRGWRWLMRYRRAKRRFGVGRPPRAAAALPRPAAADSAAPAAAPTPADGMPAAVADAPAPPVVPDTLESITLLPSLHQDEAARILGRSIPDESRHRVDIVCFSIIDWEFRYQRPQQIMSQFAAHGHRVFYISASRFRSGSAADHGVRLIKDRVYEVQLSARRTPDIYGEVIGGDNAQTILESLAELRRTYDISSAVAYVMIPSWTDVALEAGQRWDWPVVYDCMDEWENFQGIKRALVEAETGLVRRCELLVVSAARLEDKWRSSNRPMVLARNAVDYDFYATRCRPNQLLADASHPIVGYFGAIADWFDVDLLVKVAERRPKYTFVLLGGVFDIDVDRLKALPNVRLLGQQPYATMPQYLYHFDACLIPFKVNPITEATDPVKLYEYLSAGKPVVSVRLPELEPYREHLYLASGAEEFVDKLDRAVSEHDRERADKRRQFASHHTWTDRYRRIREALSEACEPASIIIVTYNNMVVTQLCLESILHNTGHPNYEVIVVDNASTDGTRAYLRHMTERHPEIRVILNASNQGFSHANNQGLAESRGRHIVLLNNDTVVPTGWLARLTRHLNDPEIGLVGPVTNFVGNEAKVEVSYTTWAEMDRFAAERARRFEGHVADIHMLAMFCVAMRRDTFEQVGPLDERFGIGMFEDDDYAHRIREAGQRVVCAADVFVHHIGQAAFKKLIENGQYNDLFDRNRKAYEDKWNVQWRRHEHAQLAYAPSRAHAAATTSSVAEGT